MHFSDDDFSPCVTGVCEKKRPPVYKALQSDMLFRPQNMGQKAYRYIALSIKTVVIFADTGIVHRFG